VNLKKGNDSKAETSEITDAEDTGCKMQLSTGVISEPRKK
jgi:hypothetical protein